MHQNLTRGIGAIGNVKKIAVLVPDRSIRAHLPWIGLKAQKNSSCRRLTINFPHKWNVKRIGYPQILFPTPANRMQVSNMKSHDHSMK